MNESTQAEEVVERLRRERAYDAAALSISARIRSSLSLEDVLQQSVDELGKATGSSRCLLQLAPNAEGVSQLIEWDRGDTKPLGLRPPTPIARAIFTKGEAVVIGDIAEFDGDPEIAAYLERVGSVSAISLPITWLGEVVAAVGFQDTRPRDWETHDLPLLHRLDSQLAAAIVQAEAFERQRAAVAELENLTRLREELIANVSHELRTPLAAIGGFAKTLRRHDLELDEEQRGKMLRIIDEQTDRLTVLTEELLDLARFHRGAIRLERQAVALGEIVRSAATAVEMPSDRELVLDLDDDVRVDCDPNRMQQVVVNLLVNAIRHGRGTITVRGRASGGTLVVQVSDEGAGVASDFEDEMFLPFSHRGGRGDSSGLGLAISRAIVEAHGGSLDYEAGGGSESHQFVVELPGSDPEPAP
jgi:signal transduction histidine kinase